MIMIGTNASAQDTCEQKKKKAVTSIRNQADFADVTHLVDIINASLRICGFTVQELISDVEFKKLIQKGYASQYEVYRNRIESYVLYGTEINQNDYKEALRYALYW